MQKSIRHACYVENETKVRTVNNPIWCPDPTRIRCNEYVKLVNVGYVDRKMFFSEENGYGSRECF